MSKLNKDMCLEYFSKTYPLGKEITLINGDVIEIVGKDLSHFSKYFIKFRGYEGIKSVFSSEIKRGSIKNNENPNVFGVGYIGLGVENVKKDKEYEKIYSCWHNMLKRCYDYVYKENKISYDGVTVSKEWYNFSNFYKWYKNNYIEGYELDKDLMQIGIDLKVYSKDTCCFLPRIVNNYLRRDRLDNSEKLQGLFFNEIENKWVVSKVPFGESKRKCKRFKTQEEAIKYLNNFNTAQTEKVKDYLRSLNYLPEEIIQLIK